MAAHTSMMQLLQEFKQVLLEEKEALIQNQGDRIQEIVKVKETFIDQLNEARIPGTDNQAVSELAKDIRALQETNLMLTKQAMGFVDTFLTSFQKEAQKQSVTYSKKGQYHQTLSTGILDTSL